jgi:hypothetical protein
VYTQVDIQDKSYMLINAWPSSLLLAKYPGRKCGPRSVCCACLSCLRPGGTKATLNSCSLTACGAQVPV